MARVLQMQTAINPGNSGGPVLDNNAKMLGLVAMSEEGQNLNYAVAVDVIKDFLSRSMAERSRGTAEDNGKHPKAKYYSGHTTSGSFATRAEYPEFVAYSVRDGKGSPIEV